MATHYVIRTSASAEAVGKAFKDVFFSPPRFSESLKAPMLSRARRRTQWSATRVPDADLAAVLVESQFASAKYELGTTIALLVEDSGTARAADVWLAEHNTFLGFNNAGGILRLYAHGVATRLVADGEFVDFRRG